MDPLIKQATLIDVLGILLPGGILILAVNFYGWWDVGAPWKALLGEGELSLLIYFVALSYLCGSVVHQLGAIIEEWLTKRPLRKINMHKKYWQDEEIQNAYRTYFRKDPPTESSGLEEDILRIQQIVAGREVFHAVQQSGNRPQRIVLFSAFHAMSRAMVLTLTCIIVMAFWNGKNSLISVLPTILLYAIGVAVFIYRWIKYEARCVDEAYQLFRQHINSPPQKSE